MNDHNKIKVAVLYGGKSGEHEISLISAASVIQHLDRSRFDIIPIAIDKQGRWFLNKLPDVYLSETHQLLLGENSGAHLPLPVGNAAIISHAQNLQKSDLHLDVVFPIMHGPLCEDGTIQGLLEIADLPYVGSGVLASAVAMDKDMTKRLVHAAGIPIPSYLILHGGADDHARQNFCHQVEQELGFPVFVKPARMGSSVGIRKAKTIDELQQNIEYAFQFDDKIIVEQAIDAIDIEVSVLENEQYGQPSLVSVPGQVGVAQHHEFYSYEAKYLDPQGANLVIPANLTAEQVIEAQRIGAKVFDVLECEGMARVDMLLDRVSGRLFFNEVNTIPGFTPISMYPMMWQASGIEYKELLSRLIDLAIGRHHRKQKLVRDYLSQE